MANEASVNYSDSPHYKFMKSQRIELASAEGDTG